MNKTILFQDKIRKKFFRKVLLKNPKLLVDVIKHTVENILYYFGVLNIIEVNQKYWSYIDKINLKDEIKKTKIFTSVEALEFKEEEVILLLPRKVLNCLSLQQDVIALDEVNAKEIVKKKNLKQCTVVDGKSTLLALDAKENKVTRKNILSNRNHMQRLLIVFGLLFLLAFIPMVVSLFYSASLAQREIVWTLFNFRIILVTLIPIFLLLLFFFFIFKRVWISFTITSALVYILSLSNYFKQNFRREALYFSDVFNIREGMEMAVTYKINFTDVMLLIFGATAVLILILKLLPTFVSLRLKNRIAGALVSLLILIFPVVNLYTTYAMENFTATKHSTRYDLAANYASRGVVFSFINSYGDFVGRKPEGYSQSQVDEILTQYPEVSLLENQEVNIMMVSLESYADLGKFYDLSESEVDPYFNFNKLKEDSYSGELIVDVFGGGTIETERSSMSGYRNLGRFQKETETFVQYFKRNGYATEYMHPFFKYFYARGQITPNLGFDSYLFADDELWVEQDRKDTYLWQYWKVMDNKELFSMMTDRFFDSIEMNGPTFEYTMTIQGHGPYSQFPWTEKVYLPPNDQIEEDLYWAVSHYLDWIYRADLEIQNLRESIDESDEPVVLVLFSDHLPGLGTEESGDPFEFYNVANVNMDPSEIEGILNMYGVEYLFYANDVAKEKLDIDETKEGNQISPMYLLPELFDYLNLDGSSYLNYLKELKEELPVQNIYVYKYLNEWYFRSEDLPENLEKLVSEYDAMSYYMQYKFKP